MQNAKKIKSKLPRNVQRKKANVADLLQMTKLAPERGEYKNELM